MSSIRRRPADRNVSVQLADVLVRPPCCSDGEQMQLGAVCAYGCRRVGAGGWHRQ